jgi:hypothetical protein
MTRKYPLGAVLVFTAVLLAAMTLTYGARVSGADSGAAPAADWQPLDPATAPPARYGHTLVTLSDGNAYLFGGFVQQTGLSAAGVAAPADILPDSDLWVFNEESVRWLEITAPNPPKARAAHSAAANHDQMYVFGGLDSNYTLIGDLAVYNATSNSWSTRPSGPPPRKNHKSIVLDGKLIVIGGMDAYDNPQNDLWIFDVVADTWSQGAAPPANLDLYDFVLTSDGQSAYVMGMGNNEVYIYTSDTNQWRTAATNPGPAKRFGAGGTANTGGGSLAASAAGAGARAWLWGGNDDATWDVLADAWEFDLAALSWTRVADLPMALTNSAGTWLGDRVLVFGGQNGSNQPQRQTWVYRPAGAAGPTWTGATNSDWAEAGNWSGGLPGGGDTATIPNVANQPVIGAATDTAIGGLTIQSGALVTVNGALTLGSLGGDGSLTVHGLLVVTGDAFTLNGVLTNHGELRQSREVTSAAEIAFLGAGGYGGVVINANGLDLGSTEVRIKGNQDCTTVAGETVKRCFDIEPTNTTGLDATVTFYFASSEIPAGQSCGNMNGYHWTGSAWELLTLDTTYGANGRSCGSDPQSIRVKNVSAFSPFVIKETGPNAVTLHVLAARATPGRADLLALALAGLLGLGVCERVRRLRPRQPLRSLRRPLWRW